MHELGGVFSFDEVHTRSLGLRVAVVIADGVAVLKYLAFVVAVIIAVELEQDPSKKRPQPQPQPQRRPHRKPQPHSGPWARLLTTYVR